MFGPTTMGFANAAGSITYCGRLRNKAAPDEDNRRVSVQFRQFAYRVQQDDLRPSEAVGRLLPTGAKGELSHYVVVDLKARTFRAPAKPDPIGRSGRLPRSNLLGMARSDHQPVFSSPPSPANDPQGFEDDLFLTAGGASGN